MKIALAQINPTIGDFDNNTEKIVAATQKAINLSCDLVVFSELAISGYPPRDLLEKRDFIKSNLACLQKLVNSIKGIGVICGFIDENPAKKGNRLFNSAAIFNEGQILHKAHKKLLPAYDVFDESRYFEPGKKCTIFAFEECRIGLTICEDIWNDRDFLSRQLYPFDPVEREIKEGANLLINIAASPYHAGKREFKWDMFKAISQKYRVPLLYINQVGGNDSVLFDGISLAQ